MLGKLGVFSFLGSLFWPLLILLPGALLHFFYFNRTLPAGALVPGGILVTVSLLFFFCNLFGWDMMEYVWPGFILAVAVGLYEYYIYGNAPKGVFTAALILSLIAAAFFGFMLLMSAGIYLVALVLLVAGVLLVIRRPRSW